jgi:hypothetical protein
MKEMKNLMKKLGENKITKKILIFFYTDFNEKKRDVKLLKYLMKK